MMSLIKKMVDFLRRSAIFVMVGLIVMGLLMLYFKAQNDLLSPNLFLYKAIFFPLSLLLLLKAWLLAFVVSKHEKNGANRKWPLCVALLLTLLFLPHILPNWQRSAQFSEAANQQGFSVATFSAMTRSRNANDIKSFIQKYQPQILCLQEVTDEDMEVLSSLYPYRAQHRGAGLVIFSQFQQQTHKENNGKTQLSDSIKNIVQSIELTLPNQRTVNILNVHMPRQYRQDGHSANALKSIQWHLESNFPVIFCGDFNMTPQHTIYDYLTQQLGLSDAQLSQAWEYGFTFPNGNRRLSYFGTWLRIDYLFFRGFVNGDTRVINASNLSDHKAVLSTFLLAE